VLLVVIRKQRLKLIAFSLATACVVLVLEGCRHAPAVAAPEGRSSFRFVESSLATSEYKLGIAEGPRQPVDVLVPAEPILPLAQPAYPKAARGGLTIPALVGVQITVGADGRVTQVGPSMKTISTPSPFAAEFLSAVEEAVAQWHFTPAEKRRLVPGRGRPGGEDYWVVTRAEKTEYAFDLSFTFALSGDVVPSPPAR
jgi:hypothetical protein